MTARGESPAAFTRRCIPPWAALGVVHDGVKYSRYSPSSRLARADRGFGIILAGSRCDAGLSPRAVDRSENRVAASFVKDDRGWRSVRMNFARFGLGVFGFAGLIAATLAGATVWLVLTDPVTVADAVSEGEISPLIRELADVLYRALRDLLRYL